MADTRIIQQAEDGSLWINLQPLTKAEEYGGVPRDELKDSDFVFPDERKFPIKTRGDVEDAVSVWGRYKGGKSFEDFKSRLKAIARRKGFEDALPESWKEEEKES
jgi:hypothetical protein